jgi:hypothetical protein
VSPKELKLAIDKISDIRPRRVTKRQTDWSRTVRGTPFETISNGYIKAEGEPRRPTRSMDDMCHAALEAAKTLRNRIKGPCVLTWRTDPMADGDGSLYMRLAFEHQ